MIGEDCAPLPHRFRSNRTLVWTQANADKALRQFSLGLCSDQFVGEVASPEIDAGHLEELARGLAEQLDQGIRVGSLARLGGNTEEKLLEALIGPRGKTIFRGNDRTATRNA